MSEKLTRLVQEIDAQDPSGDPYVVELWETFIVFIARDGSRQERTSEQNMKTSDGEIVNHIAKGKYEIVRPGGKIVLTSSDPNAF